jgi:hypothetical protein
MTVFDSREDPLPENHGYDQESLEEALRTNMPSLFREAPAKAKGLGLFGQQERPFVALTFVGAFFKLEQVGVTAELNPVLDIDDIDTPDVKPHLSVARAFSRERAREVKASLQSCLPPTIIFNPARVEFRPGGGDNDRM